MLLVCVIRGIPQLEGELQRMKRRIYWSLCSIALAAMLLCTAASLFVYYGFFEDQVKAELRNECEIVASAARSAEDAADFYENLRFADRDTRITVVNPDGSVLYDSRAEAATLPNHGDRPEVIEALEGGSGEMVRHSATLGQNTYYYATRLESGSVLRLAKDTSGIFSVFVRILPIVVVVAAALFAVCLLISRAITRHIVDPLMAMGDNLDNAAQNTGYDELAPFLSKIAHQDRTIRRQLEEMREERDTINLIMDNMQEGLVLISAGRKILSFNESAAAFLSAAGEHDFTDRNIIAMTRNQNLLEAIDQAVSGEGASGLIESGEKSCRFFASPVRSEGEITGVILFLVDVTEQLKAERVRQEFSANVSHELKTPLTSISGFAEMIQTGMVQDAGEIHRFSGMIYDEARRLLALIDDIMRLSRIEENSVEENAVSVNLYSLARGVCISLKPLAQKRDITLRAGGENVLVRGNLSMLNEMVMNICENAVKYNVQGGSVDVEVHEVEENGTPQALIRVSDTGIGIPAEHHDRIFERFYRVDKSRSKQTGGTGLGLSIVKHIVEYHHGEIRFESEEGKGTVVTVVLPKASQSEARKNVR